MGSIKYQLEDSSPILGGEGLCSRCGNRWGLHYIRPHYRRNTGNRLVFECQDGFISPQDYDPLLPFDMQLGLGHSLTNSQRNTFLAMIRKRNIAQM